MDAYIINPDGTEIEVIPKNGKAFILQELYEHLGCNIIEFLKTKNNEHLLVDEEGNLKPNQKINYKATILDQYNRTIVGKALICKLKMIK